MSNAFMTYGGKPVMQQAKDLNKSATAGAGAFVGSTSGISKTAGTEGLASTVGNTADFGAQRSSAVDEYGRAIGLSPEDQAAYDKARSDYEASLT
jgi:hypothetical protein